MGCCTGYRRPSCLAGPKDSAIRLGSQERVRILESLDVYGFLIGYALCIALPFPQAVLHSHATVQQELWALVEVRYVSVLVPLLLNRNRNKDALAPHAQRPLNLQA